jgi:hypothetical protein
LNITKNKFLNTLTMVFIIAIATLMLSSLGGGGGPVQPILVLITLIALFKMQSTIFQSHEKPVTL